MLEDVAVHFVLTKLLLDLIVSLKYQRSQRYGVRETENDAKNQLLKEKNANKGSNWNEEWQILYLF